MSRKERKGEKGKREMIENEKKKKE